MTGYEIYSQWCRDHGQEPPTEDWWKMACAVPRLGKSLDNPELMKAIRADQREIDRERREGWAYD